MARAYRLFSFCLIVILLALSQPVLADQEPVVRELAKTLKEDKKAKIILKGKSPLRKKLSYSIVQLPQHGSITLKGKKAVYQPSPDYYGADSFQYAASDGELSSTPATVYLTIKPVNDKPVAQPQTQTLPMGITSEFTLNATDAEGDTLSYLITSKPKRGKVTLNGNVVTYTPKKADFQGKDRFKFKAKDGKSASKPAKVNILLDDTDLQNTWFEDLSFGSGESDIYVLEGNSTEISLNLALSPDTQMSDIEIQVSEGQNFASASNATGQWLLAVDSKDLPAGASVPIVVSITNSKLGISANKATTLQILAPIHTEKTNIDSAGGELKTSAGSIEVLANNLTSSVGVTIQEGLTPAGGRLYVFSFDEDVSSSDLKIVLPDPNTLASAKINASNKVTNQATGLNEQIAIEPSSFSVPYEKDKKSLGHDWGELLAYFTDTGDHRLRSGVPISISGFFNNTLKANSKFEVHIYTASRLYSVLPFDTNPIDIGDYEPVLFVHGFAASFTTANLGGGKGTWQNFPKLAMYRSQLNDIGLIPFEFRWATDARFVDVAGDLVKSINKIHRITGKKIHIVAHSFGGVLARTVLQDLAYGPTQQEKDDARAAVKSLLTLGSPHSGIADKATSTNPSLPPGQDAASFEFCDQLSCYVMGENIFKTSAEKTKSLLGLDTSPGEHALQLANTVDKLPDIPIFVGIGLTADRGSNGKYDNGDYLISYRGQRFLPTDTTGTLRKGKKIGQATVYETVLGSKSDVVPGDTLNSTELGTERPKGYLHSGRTGLANFWKDDGENDFGVEAAPILNCTDESSTCTHAGYLLFKDLISNDLCQYSKNSNCSNPQVTSKLNDTGITTCSNYDSNGLACPATGFPGQDAQFGRDALALAGTLQKVGGGSAGFDFTKIANNGAELPATANLGSGPNDWACTRDNVTGLVWEVKTDNGGFGDLRDKDNTYTWYEPDSSKNGGSVGVQSGGSCPGYTSCDTHGYVQSVNYVGLCGANDWRLPDRNELISIIDNSRSYPSIDINYFPNTFAKNQYDECVWWSSSPIASNSDDAWNVDFGHRNSFVPNRDNKASHYRIRLVRGGQ